MHSCHSFLVLDSDTHHLTPFVSSVQEMFTSMLGCDATAMAPVQISTLAGECRIISIVGLNGPVRGAVALVVPIETAMAMTRRFIGMEVSQVDVMIVDAVSEMVNIIAGNAKTKLNIDSQEPVTLSIPTVVMGHQNELLSPSWSIWREVNFDSALGFFSLRVTME